MIYPSKKDRWIALILVVTGLVELGVGSVLISVAVVQAAPLPVLPLGVLLLLVGALIFWIYSTTGYDIRPPDLLIRSGPMWFTIPLDAIAEVQQRKGVSLEIAWSFALSRDRLFIRYRKPNGRMAWLGVAISPEDQEGFLEELAREMPAPRNGSIDKDR
jgi:hypothetical protein